MNCKNFKIKKYDSIEELYCCLYKDISKKDLCNNSIKVNCMFSDGDKVEIDWKEMKLNYEEQGIWGFIDIKNTIHFWIKKGFKIKFEKLLHFFGHEIGHRVKIEKPKLKGYKNNSDVYLKEEKRADNFAEICILVYKFTKETFDGL